MRTIFKKAIKSNWFQEFTSGLISAYLKLVFYTSRWTWMGQEQADHYFDTGPLIVCFWHGRMALIPFMNHWPHKRIVALISAHDDGMMVARTFKRLKIDYINGSTNKGGARAFLSLLQVLKDKNIAGIIPDGPRGPAKKLSPGIIQLSRHSQAPIMPLAFATSRFIEFKSWDKFRLPLPFSRGIFIYGDPILPREGEDSAQMEAWRLAVEEAISTLQDKADLLIQP
ncbi:lysophospholipid acyltransferase family protein [Candidatus Odyssella thessalonicensis]|uniref:lysophospholipid acyltransferase family protein n=1 Tax=Candidatus Odyssella thessalonicensis TaxID=84647 RepID=UPI000225B1A1|nr:lysophospholipid acyltransferase family protein [Candidatus Odyssella thessalonicensis]